MPTDLALPLSSHASTRILWVASVPHRDRLISIVSQTVAADHAILVGAQRETTTALTGDDCEEMDRFASGGNTGLDGSIRLCESRRPRCGAGSASRRSRCRPSPIRLPSPVRPDSGLNGPSSPKTEAAVGSPVLTPENTSVTFVGSKVTGKHDGGFKQLKGTLQPGGEKLESSKIIGRDRYELDLCRHWQLENHLKSPDFFDVAKSPTTTFVTTGIEAGSHDAKAKDATHIVTGNLTLHASPSRFPSRSKIALAGDRFNLDSEFFINRKDFGINYPGKANDLIRDEVVIKLVMHVPVGSSTTHEASAK